MQSTIFYNDKSYVVYPNSLIEQMRGYLRKGGLSEEESNMVMRNSFHCSVLQEALSKILGESRVEKIGINAAVVEFEGEPGKVEFHYFFSREMVLIKINGMRKECKIKHFLIDAFAEIMVDNISTGQPIDGIIADLENNF